MIPAVSIIRALNTYRVTCDNGVHDQFLQDHVPGSNLPIISTITSPHKVLAYEEIITMR